MGRSTKPRNLVKRRRSQVDEALSDALVLDRVPVHVLPLTDPDPRPPSKYPLPLIARVLTYVGIGTRASGRVRALAEQREQAKNLPRGAPPVEISVMPVWDSRLVNMRDFLATPGVEPPTPGTTNALTYTVPAGYTALLRGFRYITDPPAVAGPTDVRATLLVDDSIVPDFVAMPFGPTMADYQDTFVIARQGQIITLRLVIAIALPVGTDFFAFLYGNLRLSDGRALNQEVGEKVKPAKVIVQPPPAPKAAPAACPPGHKLMRVQLADGSFEMRCVPVLGQARSKL